MIVFGAPPPEISCRDRTAAYAVISDPEGRVAVVCANVGGRDRFWLPGGGTQEGESPEETIAREVLEELGRDVRLQRHLGTAIQFFYAGDEGCWYKMTAHFFAAKLECETGACGEFQLQWIDPTRRQSDFFHECHLWATGQ